MWDFTKGGFLTGVTQYRRYFNFQNLTGVLISLLFSFLAAVIHFPPSLEIGLFWTVNVAGPWVVFDYAEIQVENTRKRNDVGLWFVNVSFRNKKQNKTYA